MSRGAADPFPAQVSPNCGPGAASAAFDLLVLSTRAFLTLEEFSRGLNEPSGGN